MGAYEELQERVAIDSVNIVQLVGVPRSISTALGRALNEIDQPSVYVNEPFNRDNADLDMAAAYLLDAYKTSLPNDAPRATIITKNMASYLTSDAFAGMDAIALGTIWNVRHPLIQIGSLLTRLANDLYVHPGEDTITQAELQPYLPGVCDFLLDSPKSQNFSKTGWQSIGGHFDTPLRAGSARLVVDGENFAHDPAACLSSVCEQLRLAYSSAMLDDWKGEFINVVNRANPAETETNAWTRHAARSVGVVAVQRTAVNLTELPGALQEYITSVALPTYERIISDAGSEHFS